MIMTRNALSPLLSNAEQSYRSKEDECQEKYHGASCSCLFSSGKSKSVVLNMVS